VQFKRGRANQPDPAFPQSPGIILETNSFNLLIATVRFVLSMNCAHHSSIHQTDNKLICTPCSPNQPGEPWANKAKKPIKSVTFLFFTGNLLTVFRPLNSGGEQVFFGAFQKNPARQKNFEEQNSFGEIHWARIAAKP
jgi:hypothetical protein